MRADGTVYAVRVGVYPQETYSVTFDTETLRKLKPDQVWMHAPDTDAPVDGKVVSRREFDRAAEKACG